MFMFVKKCLLEFICQLPAATCGSVFSLFSLPFWPKAKRQKTKDIHLQGSDPPSHHQNPWITRLFGEHGLRLHYS